MTIGLNGLKGCKSCLQILENVVTTVLGVQISNIFAVQDNGNLMWNQHKVYIIVVMILQPIPQMEHNGPNFKYIVGYKRADDRNAEFREAHVNDWTEGRVVIGGQDTFVKYEIYVMAANNVGQGSSRSLRHIFGYSGEGGK